MRSQSDTFSWVTECGTEGAFGRFDTSTHALKRATERIEHSFQSDVSLASLAEEAGYSRDH
jgi:AraC-like DNA-binding protein